jgi:hypothetical protein
MGMLVLAVGFAVGSAQSPALSPAIAALDTYTRRAEALFSQGLISQADEQKAVADNASLLLNLEAKYMGTPADQKDHAAYKESVDKALEQMLAALPASLPAETSSGPTAKPSSGGKYISADALKKEEATQSAMGAGQQGDGAGEMSASEAKKTLDNAHRKNMGIKDPTPAEIAASISEINPAEMSSATAKEHGLHTAIKMAKSHKGRDSH